MRAWAFSPGRTVESSNSDTVVNPFGTVAAVRLTTLQARGPLARAAKAHASRRCRRAQPHGRATHVHASLP